MPWVKRGRKTVYVNPKHAGGRKRAKELALAIAKAPVGAGPKVKPTPARAPHRRASFAASDIAYVTGTPYCTRRPSVSSDAE